jgi:hypothetical protein
MRTGRCAAFDKSAGGHFLFADTCTGVCQMNEASWNSLTLIAFHVQQRRDPIILFKWPTCILSSGNDSLPDFSNTADSTKKVRLWLLTAEPRIRSHSCEIRVRTEFLSQYLRLFTVHHHPQLFRTHSPATALRNIRQQPSTSSAFESPSQTRHLDHKNLHESSNLSAVRRLYGLHQ